MKLTCLIVLTVAVASGCHKNSDGKEERNSDQTQNGDQVADSGVPLAEIEYDFSAIKHALLEIESDGSGNIKSKRQKTYDGNGNITEDRKFDGAGKLKQSTLTKYNDQNRVLEEVLSRTNASGTVEIERRVSDYANGLLIKTTVHEANGKVFLHFYTYDAQNRLIKTERNYENSTYTTEYDWPAKTVTEKSNYKVENYSSSRTSVSIYANDFVNLNGYAAVLRGALASEESTSTQTSSSGSTTETRKKACTAAENILTCTSTTHDKNGVEVGTETSKLALSTATITGLPAIFNFSYVNIPQTSELESTTKKLTSQGKWQTVSQLTRYNLLGQEVLSQRQTDEGDGLKPEIEKIVTTYDKSGLNQVKKEEYESESLSSTTTYDY